MNVKYYRLIPQYLLLFLLTTNIYIFWPFSEISFEIPKVWFINRVIEIIGIISLFFSFTLKRTKYDKKLVYLSIAFLLTTIISSISGMNFHKSVIGNYYRADGLFTLTHFYILLFFLLLYFKKNWLGNIFKVIAYTNLILNIWVITNYLLSFFTKPFITSWDGAIGINFGNPNFLSGYLLVTLPFTLHLYKNKKNRLFKIAFVFQIIAIFLTQSWAGILGSILYVSYIVLNKDRNLKAWLIATFIILIATISFIKNYQQTFENDRLVAESRERIFVKGLLAFKKRPIFGWGWANFDYAFESIDWPIKIHNDAYVDKAHSNILEMLVTTGLVGFIFYLGLLYKVGRNLYFFKSVYSKYLLATFFLYILHSQTNITSISEELIFWILAGISLKVTT